MYNIAGGESPVNNREIRVTSSPTTNVTCVRRWPVTSSSPSWASGPGFTGAEMIIMDVQLQCLPSRGNLIPAPGGRISGIDRVKMLGDLINWQEKTNSSAKNSFIVKINQM